MRLERTLLALLALLLAAGPAAAQGRPRQNVSEYLEAALKRDDALSSSEQRAVLAAVQARFAAYATAVVRPGQTQAADVAMRMIIEGSFDEAPPERAAEVAFAAYQAVSRGAPAEVVEGIALYGYRKKIPGDRISVWANGYQHLVTQKVPPAVAADLVRNAMELGWEDSTFNTLKWSLAQAAREKFEVHDYAVFLFGHMASGKERPGALTARAHGYFKKLAKTKAKPELPPYDGAFSRAPAAPQPLYEAPPALEEPQAPALEPLPPAAPAVPAETPPAPVKAQAAPKPAPVEEKPAPPVRRAVPDYPVLWPGLDRSARSYLGTPYVWGGVTRKGIDCSALTQNSYGENRVGIPRVSRDQWKTGKKVEWDGLREGDLIFFNTMGVGVSHVGMVVNAAGPRFIHASSSRGVVIDDLPKKYYKSRYLGARRIVP